MYASLVLGWTRRDAPTSLQASSRIHRCGEAPPVGVMDQARRLVPPREKTPGAIKPRVASHDENSIALEAHDLPTQQGAAAL